MQALPEKLNKKLTDRKTNNAFRELSITETQVDFASNDYLGFAKNKTIYNNTIQLLANNKQEFNGSGGSRLLTGNYKLYNDTEQLISQFHNSENALIFNSGYTANIGVIATLTQRGDTILFDELSHASIREALLLSNAKSIKFKHNNLTDLEAKLQQVKSGTTYIITESVFSMDGDIPNLKKLTDLANTYNARIILDEAHGLGVFGESGQGLAQQENLEASIFIRIMTFGKALGCHGAAVICNNDVRDYLINFSRAFIYTTSLPQHSVATIYNSYKALSTNSIKTLRDNITYFKANIKSLNLTSHFIDSDSAIQCCIISGNNEVKQVANQLQSNGFNVKPILSPTVNKGAERLRICLHSYNTTKEIDLLTTKLNQYFLALKA